MIGDSKTIILRDATLREGLDVPHVDLTSEQRLRLVKKIDAVGVSEIEIVAPGKVADDLAFARRLRGQRLRARTSGLVYSHRPHCRQEIARMGEHIDRLDLLMPASPLRGPVETMAKIDCIVEALDDAMHHGIHAGVGFPQATQTSADVVHQLCSAAVAKGASRVTIYDTNGSSDPFAIHTLIQDLRRQINVELFFHAHNDLGMATANSLAAVYAGADGLDVTVNGLGDRAGNCSLEQIAVTLHLKGFSTGIELKELHALSRSVVEESGVATCALAPVVGEHIFSHKSPAHLEDPGLFEAYDPGLVGGQRRFVRTGGH